MKNHGRLLLLTEDRGRILDGISRIIHERSRNETENILMQESSVRESRKKYLILIEYRVGGINERINEEIPREMPKGILERVLESISQCIWEE